MSQVAANREALELQKQQFLSELGDREISMTEATELLWGTSGSGNPTAKAFIRKYADQGLIRIVRRGRGERVSRG